MRKLAAMILAAALLLGAGVPAAAAGERAAHLRYTHYDADAFYEGVEHLYELADGGYDAAAAMLYDKLYDELARIDTMEVLAMLGHYDDLYDDYWAEEYDYARLLGQEAGDALCAAAGYVLESGCAEAFRAHVGDDAADYFLTYEPMTDEQADNYDRQHELIEAYYARFDDIGDTEAQYGDEIWTLDALSGDAGDALADRDYDAYSELYDRMQQALTLRFAPGYIELVQLRAQQAREAGYDSYADYAYENVFCRGYTAAEAQALCDRVKPIAREYYASLYYSDLAYAAGDVRPVMDADALLEVLGAYLPRVDASLTEPLALLTEDELYDLAPEAEGRVGGAFTVPLMFPGVPYIYAALEGDCYDLATLTHEFGHFTNFLKNPVPNWLVYGDDLELSEIHSNGLQALFTCFYGEIYDEGADAAEFLNLSFLLENVIDGCLFDEFQRRVYARADELDAETLNALYIELCDEYGVYDGYYAAPAWDASWVYIGHNFESPLYYISYAVSALSAIELWAMAQEDFQAAADAYLAVLGHGAWAETYFEVMEACSLLPFTDEAAVEPCRVLLDRLRALDAPYAW